MRYQAAGNARSWWRAPWLIAQPWAASGAYPRYLWGILDPGRMRRRSSERGRLKILASFLFVRLLGYVDGLVRRRFTPTASILECRRAGRYPSLSTAFSRRWGRSSTPRNKTP